MTNNDILRRLRYAFDFGDDKMIALFAKGGRKVDRAQVSNLLKREDDPAHVACHDIELATFLNGLIIDRRGRREGPLPEPEKRLNNNAILTKLKIALSLRSEDLAEIMHLAEYRVSAHELSALFRKPSHKHYRLCQDQMLRNFLRGLQIKIRE
jgi:uncharacterized protein YehS (DUF1456 family)